MEEYNVNEYTFRGNPNTNVIAYVSSSSTSNTQDGSIESPFKTISSALNANKKIVFLKCGDVFYEKDLIIDGVILKSYSSGQRPCICGFSKYTARSFVQDSINPNIWTLNLNTATFSGITNIGVNKDLGFIYDPISDKIIFGHRVSFLEESQYNSYYASLNPTEKVTREIQATYLHEDGDFFVSKNGILYVYFTPVNELQYYQWYGGIWQRVYFTPNNVRIAFNSLEQLKAYNPGSNAGAWYICSAPVTITPNSYQELDFSFSSLGLRTTSNPSVVEGIKLKGFGRHAITDSTEGMVGFVARDLEIDLIGGSTGSAPHDNDNVTIPVPIVRLGNGIEAYITFDRICCDILVEKCRISRVVDSALTIQGSFNNSTDISKRFENFGLYPYAAKNIRFEHNTITHCRQAFEAFCTNTDYSSGTAVTSKPPYNNCCYRLNKSSFIGDNGFNCHERRDTHILSGANGMIIERNDFIGGDYIYVRDCIYNVFLFNRHFIEKGAYMCRYMDDNNTYIYQSIQWPDNGDASTIAERIKLFQSATGDTTVEFIEVDSTQVKLLSEI